jgi:hypothetical protein
VLQDADLVAQEQDPGGLSRLLAPGQTQSHHPRFRRKTNHRHMVGDHYGRAADTATVLLTPTDGILGTHKITQTIGLGFNPPSQQWPLYAFIVAEPIGFLLNQNAFQESSLIAPVLAIRTVTDPLVAIGIGLVWLNEQIASSPAAIAAEVVGLISMSVGVLALAYRSPHLAAQSSRPALKSEGRESTERR